MTQPPKHQVKTSNAPKLPAPKIAHVYGERGAGGSGLLKRGK